MIRHPALSAVPRRSSSLPFARLRAGLGRSRSWRERRGRRALAEGYERLVRAAERPVVGLTARAPIRRAAVRASRPELLTVAELLRAPQRLDRAGVDAARRLLRDGNGPVYVEGDLEGALRWILERLAGGPRP